MASPHIIVQHHWTSLHTPKHYHTYTQSLTVIFIQKYFKIKWLDFKGEYKQNSLRKIIFMMMMMMKEQFKEREKRCQFVTDWIVWLRPAKAVHLIRMMASFGNNDVTWFVWSSERTEKKK